MKGNYQRQQPKMKFSPEAAGASSRVFEIQHYKESSLDDPKYTQPNFALAPQPGDKKQRRAIKQRHYNKAV